MKAYGEGDWQAPRNWASLKKNFASQRFVKVPDNSRMKAASEGHMLLIFRWAVKTNLHWKHSDVLFFIVAEVWIGDQQKN
jgi:hypothetical protein